MLALVKLALRITTDAFDAELNMLSSAALADLGLTDISEDVLTEDTNLALIQRAVITYVRCNFGEPDEYDRMKASYDEQKAQLLMSSDYTDWGGCIG